MKICSGNLCVLKGAFRLLKPVEYELTVCMLKKTLEDEADNTHAVQIFRETSSLLKELKGNI